MGQKVSPIGLRMGINKTWEAKWFAGNKEFAQFLENDVKIRKFLYAKLKDWRTRKRRSGIRRRYRNRLKQIID